MRRTYIEYYLKVSKELLKYQNFNAMMEIVSALGSSSIGRLKKSWNDKLNQQFAVFTSFLEKNFAKLRAATDHAQLPFLPYIGVYMKDLMMIDEGNDSPYLIQFENTFTKLRNEMYESLIEKRNKDLGNMSVFPLVGSALLIVMISFGVMEVIGGMISGL